MSYILLRENKRQCSAHIKILSVPLYLSSAHSTRDRLINSTNNQSSNHHNENFRHVGSLRLTALIFFHAGRPGSTIFLAMRSASMTGTPSSRNILLTVLFPVATPPVKPTRNMAAAAAAMAKWNIGGRRGVGRPETARSQYLSLSLGLCAFC